MRIPGWFQGARNGCKVAQSLASSIGKADTIRCKGAETKVVKAQEVWSLADSVMSPGYLDLVVFEFFTLSPTLT